MSVWAIADLHLSFGVANKKMDVFGVHWKDHAQKIQENWNASIQDSDLVLIPGDISWAMDTERAKADLDWIDALPGTKLLLKGNHDYWWTSLSKVKKVLPPSCHLIQNDAFHWNNVTVGGTRLWDSYEYNFNRFVEVAPGTELPQLSEEELIECEKIFIRELQRLELSLKALSSTASKRIVMTHYPPISAELDPSRVSELLERFHVDICVFGHLHNLQHRPLFGKRGGVDYKLVACDYLDFKPLQLL